MKQCPTKAQLEEAVLAEVHDGRDASLDAHAEGCARCRHEVNWLRAESTMFAQRAAREEVSRLWETVDARSNPKRGRSLTRAMFAIAASVLLAVVATRFVSPVGRAPSRDRGEAVPMSLEMMSVDFGGGSDSDSDGLATMPCYTPGFGIACGEVEYASR